MTLPCPAHSVMQLTGRVIKKSFAAGSKSERDAIKLVTDEGEFVLRRKGGNPFFDAELEKLVDKTITCEGDLTGYTFIMNSWAEASDKTATSKPRKPK